MYSFDVPSSGFVGNRRLGEGICASVVWYIFRSLWRAKYLLCVNHILVSLCGRFCCVIFVIIKF